MVRFYIHALRIFKQSHSELWSVKQYGSAEEMFCRDVFYKNKEDWQAHKNGIFAEKDLDYKDFLQRYFNIEL